MRANYAATLACILALTACGGSGSGGSGSGGSGSDGLLENPRTFDTSAFTSARVTKIVDGDTVDVSIDGDADTVRLVGVDTPETSGSNTPSEYDNALTEAHLREWGNRAADWLGQVIPEGAHIFLEFDSNEGRRGSFGRLLAYIYTEDGVLIGRQLLKQGYARAYTEGDAIRESIYSSLEQRARDQCEGLWGPLCEGDGAEYSCSSSPNCGQIGSCQEARFRLTQCGQESLDGDNDGVPCESICE
ncbi:thermonuclease family protein [Halofilum ochraceum]|uniref:thermonuclease family protein n=1 Tax=Halofilum ochraceum TaxID=1611323 RepID=UPI000835B4D2|nr:thermonuclease family protein [Halofilum ochraceum]